MNIARNVYTESNDLTLNETKPMNEVEIEDWLALNNDNINIEWRRLCNINLEPDLEQHDLYNLQHGLDLIKPKTMHNVKINDWFTMNNDNIDIEWRHLNMINLDNDLDNNLDDDNMDTDITSEWN